jgi:hypothetical protein
MIQVFGVGLGGGGGGVGGGTGVSPFLGQPMSNVMIQKNPTIRLIEK